MGIFGMGIFGGFGFVALGFVGFAMLVLLVVFMNSVVPAVLAIGPIGEYLLHFIALFRYVHSDEDRKSTARIAL